MSINKVVEIFRYDNNLCFIGKSFVECREDGTFTLTPNATTIKPKKGLVYDNKTSFLVFDKRLNEWKVIDFNNQMVINKITKEITKKSIYNYQNSNYTTDIPSSRILLYVEWNDENNCWVISEDKKEDVVKQLWTLRKFIRDRKCGKDLEYNGHTYHVNKRSLLDIFMASFTMENDNDETVWITADSDKGITVTKKDLVNILVAYRKRREQLVLEANEKWKEDEKLTTDELFIEFEKVYKESLSYLNNQQ